MESNRDKELDNAIDPEFTDKPGDDNQPSLGELLSYLEHEVNNAITPAVAMIDLLLADIAEVLSQLNEAKDKASAAEGLARSSQLISESAGVINLTAERINNVSQWLKSIGSGKTVEMKKTDVVAEIESTLRYFLALLPPEVTVIRELKACPAVMSSPGQLQQVIINLLRNAERAIEGPGIITVQTAHEGKNVRISFKDTGQGMTQEEASSAFRPGYTTKRAGAGLGLAISRRIVENHRGRISIGSKPGEGTTVTITLPVAE